MEARNNAVVLTAVIAWALCVVGVNALSFRHGARGAELYEGPYFRNTADARRIDDYYMPEDHAAYLSNEAQPPVPSNPIEGGPPIMYPQPTQPYNVEYGHHDEYEPVHYTFEYAVDNPGTGDMKGHKESRQGDMVTGYYWLREPDGGVRHVHYTADKHSGFKPTVTKTAPPVHHHHKTVNHHWGYETTPQGINNYR